MVCQNQTIDDSDAELAHDLRVLLRQRLKAGDTDQQAIAFLVNRYGDYVLLKPPFEAETLLLWLGPLLVLAGGRRGCGFLSEAASGCRAVRFHGGGTGAAGPAAEGRRGMTLWIILTVMIALVAAGLTIPLVRRYEQRPGRARTLDILKGQLAEVDTQQAGNLIAQPEADALRAEIKRRILAEDRETAGRGAAFAGGRHALGGAGSGRGGRGLRHRALCPDGSSRTHFHYDGQHGRVRERARAAGRSGRPAAASHGRSLHHDRRAGRPAAAEPQ